MLLKNFNINTIDHPSICRDSLPFAEIKHVSNCKLASTNLTDLVIPDYFVKLRILYLNGSLFEFLNWKKSLKTSYEPVEKSNSQRYKYLY